MEQKVQAINCIPNFSQVQQMREILNVVNTRISGQDWKSAPHDYQFATLCELLELADHMKWKWWAKGEPNLKEAKLEVIDCFFFVLSYMEHKGSADCAYDLSWLREDDFEHSSKTPFHSLIKDITTVSCQDCGEINFALHDLCKFSHKLNMTADETVVLFAAKGALNMFRQMNGYKEGTYKKIWGDYEDNYHLNHIVDYCVPAEFAHCEGEFSPREIYIYILGELTECYAEFAF